MKTIENVSQNSDFQKQSNNLETVGYYVGVGIFHVMNKTKRVFELAKNINPQDIARLAGYAIVSTPITALKYLTKKDKKSTNNYQ